MSVESMMIKCKYLVYILNEYMYSVFFSITTIFIIIRLNKYMCTYHIYGESI